MARWLTNVLKRIHELAAAGRVRLTYKAEREALALEALGFGLGPEDVRDTLGALSAHDSAGRFPSGKTGEWMYVFKPDVAGLVIYLKVVLRDDCVVVSFHEDGGGDEQDE